MDKFFRATIIKMETQTQRTNLWTWVQRMEGESGMYGESNMEIYITICKIDSQW